MLKNILIVVVIVIVAVISYAAMQPSDYIVSRSLTIKATPDRLFPHINNAQLVYAWMPWKEADPKAVMNYSGPTEGVGAVASWNSEGQLGVGKSEVIESIPNQLVKTRISYTKPMVMEQLSEMTLTPTAEGTVVKWSVTGQNSLVAKVAGLFFDVEKYLGGEFDKGLNSLKSGIEANG